MLRYLISESVCLSTMAVDRAFHFWLFTQLSSLRLTAAAFHTYEINNDSDDDDDDDIISPSGNIEQ